jgi:hypothetical protein
MVIVGARGERDGFVMHARSDSPIAFERYPARRGAVWLKQAYAMLSQHRLPWLMLLVLYYFVVAFVELVPYIGRHAAFVLKPVFEVGFLAAAWAQERGEVPHPRHLFQGFRANLWVLIPLGIVLVAGISLAVFATALVDGGALLDVLFGKTPPDDPNLPTVRMQLAMLFGAACAVPFIFAMWFAPALVVFQDCGTLQSLSTSLAAATANWRPIVIYGLLVFLFLGVVPGVVIGIAGLIVPSYVAFIIVMPYVLLVVATLHVADYVCYRDIFHAHESRTGAVAAGEQKPQP